MEVEIAPPSPAQMRKLHMGHPFRAKLQPGGLKVMASSKEAKKLAKASMKGSGVTLSGCKCVGCGMCGGALNQVPPRVDPRVQSRGMGMRGGEVVPKGNVKSVAKEQGKRLMVAGTDRAVRALEGSGLAEQAVRMAKSKAKKGMMGGEVVPKGNVKSVAKEQGKRLLVAGTDRAVRALEGSGMMDALVTRAVMDGSGVRSAVRASSAMNMGGKISRRNKFNKWFKDIGQKFKPIAKNLKPIKQAATARAVDFIENYNNPQAQLQTGIDMFQKEAKDTAGLFSKGKKRGQSYGSASVPDYEPAPAGLRRGTFIQPPSAPPTPPQAVDVNDDGEADGYFFPNEASWFGAGMKKKRGRGAPPTQAQARAMLRGSAVGRPTIQPVVRPQPARGSGAKKSSPWIEHVKAYCAKHGCKYSDGLKQAKASYKKGGALYPAGFDPRYDR